MSGRAQFLRISWGTYLKKYGVCSLLWLLNITMISIIKSAAVTQKDLHFEMHGTVAVIRLSRPAKRNALGDALVLALRNQLENLPIQARAAVIASSGRPRRRLACNGRRHHADAGSRAHCVQDGRRRGGQPERAG